MVNINKRYGDKVVIHDLNITVNDKEFLVLVGPSGCGKSTTIRAIAGLEKITDGDMIIDGKRVNDIPSKNRDIAMVFQNYALYPHMNVYENLAFALKLRQLPKDEIDRTVKETANILNIKELLYKKPGQMSGGEKQRVALGRAIVRNPKVFLMDEPLSNLDAKLRVQTRAEIKKIHKKLGVTIIYVTHDQVEAMTMGDRMAVLKDGYLQQIDTPLNIYNYPSNIFVAGFVGSPAMNFIKVKLNEIDGKFYAESQWFKLLVPEGKINKKYIEKEVIMGIRPEHMEHISCANSLLASYSESGQKEQMPTDDGISNLQTIKMFVNMLEPTGDNILVHAGHEDIAMTISVSSNAKINTEEETDFAININKIHLFDAETQVSITQQD